MGGLRMMQWSFLATGVVMILRGFYRLRHAEYYQRRAAERRLARGSRASRFSFSEPDADQRGIGWTTIAAGAMLVGVGLLPR